MGGATASSLNAPLARLPPLAKGGSRVRAPAQKGPSNSYDSSELSPPINDNNNGAPFLLEDVQRPPSSFRVRSSVRIHIPRPLSASLLRLCLGHLVNEGTGTLSSSSLASMVFATSAKCGASSSHSPRSVVLLGKHSPPHISCAALRTMAAKSDLCQFALDP